MNKEKTLKDTDMELVLSKIGTLADTVANDRALLYLKHLDDGLLQSIWRAALMPEVPFKDEIFLTSIGRTYVIRYRPNGFLCGDYFRPTYSVYIPESLGASRKHAFIRKLLRRLHEVWETAKLVDEGGEHYDFECKGCLL